MRLWLTALAVVVVALLGVSTLSRTATTTGLQGYGSSATSPGELSDAALMSGTVTPRAFVIRGYVSRLYPGSVKPLVLTVINPFGYPIYVTSIVTTVSASSSRCPSTNLRVTSFSGRVRILARHSTRIRVTSRFSHAAPNACEGARFVLHYRGLGRGY